MPETVFILGSHSVKPSDLIAAAAFLVSCISAFAAIRSSRAAVKSSRTAAKNLAREEDKEKKQREIQVATVRVDDDNEAPGPSRVIKLILNRPKNGISCEINGCEVIHPKGCRISMFVINREDGQRKYGDGDGRIIINPPLLLDASSLSVSVTLHLLKFDRRATALRFHGVLWDGNRSAISVDVVTPPYQAGQP